MPGVEVCVRQIMQILLPLTACHRHLMCMFSLGATRIWLVCCSEVLEQACEGTALFSRKKEKGVSRNYNLCLHAASTLQPE